MQTHGVLRVLFAEDHTVIRESLQLRLEAEPGLALVAVVGDGLQALRAAHTHQPDVLLLDQNMPGLLGSEVAEQLYVEGSSTGIVLLSAERDIFEAKLPGTVVRRVAKDEPYENLIAAIHEAAAFTAA
jgi:DNA-binding NarL/FixJ family response regulator